FLIARAVNQGHRAVARLFHELLQCGLLAGIAQLLRVSLLELLPALEVVVEPLAQLGARRQVALPAVERQRLTGLAPRPEAINQHADAVVRAGGIIGTLESDHAWLSSVVELPDSPAGSSGGASCSEAGLAPAFRASHSRLAAATASSPPRYLSIISWKPKTTSTRTSCDAYAWTRSSYRCQYQSSPPPARISHSGRTCTTRFCSGS